VRFVSQKQASSFKKIFFGTSSGATISGGYVTHLCILNIIRQSAADLPGDGRLFPKK